MASHDAPDDELDIDLLAASLRADESDLGAFTEVLAAKLEEALPRGVIVQRGRGGLFGPKKVRRISVDAGDQRLELRADGPAVQTFASRVSGGIVLKTEGVEVEQWLRSLSAALAEQARRSQITRQALERLLNE